MPTKKFGAGLHKVVILGTPGSGKTTLIVRLAGSSNFDGIKRTIGIDFHVVRKLLSKDIRLQVWDYAGQTHFRDAGIFEDMVHGASIFFFCYDATNLDSIDQISKWIQIARSYPKFLETKRYLVGLKIDQATSGQQIVLSNLVQKYINANSIQKHFLISAHENIGVDVILDNLSQDIMNLYQYVN